MYCLFTNLYYIIFIVLNDSIHRITSLSDTDLSKEKKEKHKPELIDKNIIEHFTNLENESIKTGII